MLRLYHWADSTMDLLDALSSACAMRSGVELSLLPAFRRRNDSRLFEAIRDFPLSNAHPRVIFPVTFHLRRSALSRLLSVDTMPHPRLFVACLQDREYIYRPNPVPGGKPVAVGHTYSLLAFLPKAERASSPPWAIFLDARQVMMGQKAAQVAQQQVAEWVETQEQATHPVPARQILAEADSYPLVKRKGMKGVVWVCSNRIFLCPPPQADRVARGHPCWYGKRFALSDSTTWPAPDKRRAGRRPWLWEQYYPRRQEDTERLKEGAKHALPVLSPTCVQQEIGQILQALGTPARRLEPRGKPVGQPKGRHLTPRTRQRLSVKELFETPKRLLDLTRYFQGAALSPADHRRRENFV